MAARQPIGYLHIYIYRERERERHCICLHYRFFLRIWLLVCRAEAHLERAPKSNSSSKYIKHTTNWLSVERTIIASATKWHDLISRHRDETREVGRPHEGCMNKHMSNWSQLWKAQTTKANNDNPWNKHARSQKSKQTRIRNDQQEASAKRWNVRQCRVRIWADQC